MKRRIVHVKLLGELGRKFGRSYSFMVRNPRDVISALANQVDGFKDYLCGAHENGVGFKLVDQDPNGMSYEGVMMSCDKLIIAPVINGSGGKGMSIGQILVGVALVALAFIPGVGTATAGALAGKFTVVGTALFGIGTSLVLTGIAGLLTPAVQTPSADSKKKDSFMFDRAVELTTQGYPIPLLYGRYLAVSPLTISSAISTEGIPV